MTLKTLGSWTLASGNTLEVVATIGAGDKPALLDLRCEWDRFPPSAKDVLEYQQRVQRAIGEALAALAGGRVLVVTV
jgi:broad specificity phosphatase PhoE